MYISQINASWAQFCDYSSFVTTQDLLDRSWTLISLVNGSNYHWLLKV